MTDPRRALIEAVARGELSPEEAAEQLAEVEAAAPQVAEPPPPAPDADISTVRVVADFGEVRVFGDASIAGAIADGAHTAEHEGSTLIVRAQLSGLGGFVFSRGGIRINTGGNRPDRVVVRMNPRLALELECKAGEVRVDGVEGPIRCDVSAGDVRIDRFRSPIDLTIKAGQVRASGLLDHGESRIRCQAGQVRLDLDPGSSVRLRASTRLGNVDLDDGQETVIIGGGAQERVIGGGAGTLDVESTLGQVEIRTRR